MAWKQGRMAGSGFHPAEWAFHATAHGRRGSARLRSAASTMPHPTVRKDAFMNILLHARAWAGAMGVVAVVAAQAQSAKPVAFQQPSAAVREVLDAPALPTREISPDHRRLALFTQRRYASAEDLARPMHKLAGLRWDMRTDAPVPRNRIESLQIRPLLEPGAAPLAKIGRAHV